MTKPRAIGASRRLRLADGDVGPLRCTGQNLLRSGRVAVVMAAGGISSRMAGAPFRGLTPVGPVTGRSLIRLQGEKVLALRARYAPRMPWIVVTSASSHQMTLQAFEREGLLEAAEFVQQDSRPALKVGREVHKQGGKMVLVPAGHGGVFTALVRNGILDRFHRKGITDIFVFQYPNVLENVCDPIMLGYHHARGHDATLKGFNSRRASEKVGRICDVDGRLAVIEYHFAAAAACHKYLANMGSYLLNVPFLRRCADSHVELPWNQTPFQLPNSPPLIREEQFLFDILAFTDRSGVLAVRRRGEYAAIKSLRGGDSPATARAALLSLYRQWLNTAGAIPDTRQARVEISPLFALDEIEVKSKICPGTVYRDGTVYDSCIAAPDCSTT